MAREGKALAKAKNNPHNVKWKDLEAMCRRYFCRRYFGDPIRKRGSHVMFKLPWDDDPLLNIQPRGKQAKPEQVRDAVRAIERLLGR